MEKPDKKENPIHRILSTKPPVYALVLLVLCLLVLAVFFDKGVMPFVARAYVSENTVPALEGLDSVSAIAKAKEAGFNVSFAAEREFSNSYDVALVMRQNPPASQKSKPGRLIHLTISEGLHQFTVPDLFDKNGTEAAEAIQKAGLSVGLTFSTPHPKLSKGKVVRTNPSEGAVVHNGDTVDVFVSSGPQGEKTELPDVTPLREAAAIQTLRSAGFVVGRIDRQKKSGMLPGQILSESPVARSLLPAGTKIDLVIAE